MDKRKVRVMDKVVDVILGIFLVAIIGVTIFITISISKEKIKEKEAKGTVQYITDEDTGVQYIVYKDAITPRLDKDGKVMVAK